MPTPRDATVDGPAQTDVERPSRHRFSSFNSFTGCPPDDERPHGATREDMTTRADTPQATSTTDALPVEHDSAEELRDEREGLQHLLAQRDERDAAARTTADRITTAEVQISKADHIEDAGIFVEPSSPLLLDTTSNRDDVRLAQSMSTAAISPSTPSPEYLHFPDAYQDRTKSPYSTTSFLRPGSKFRGTQQSDRQVYDVQVEIKDVDLAESFLCGYLRIQGLTDDHPTLTTFFEGEIIGSKYLFKTGHASWNSSEKIDMQHWARFPAWRPLAKSARMPSFTLKDYQQREHLFMRWKEYFLVPDHRVKTITGASFEGFYYICFNQSSGNVSGIYFHAKSEKYQQLELKHVDDRGCMPAIEFR